MPTAPAAPNVAESLDDLRARYDQMVRNLDSKTLASIQSNEPLEPCPEDVCGKIPQARELWTEIQRREMEELGRDSGPHGGN